MLLLKTLRCYFLSNIVQETNTESYESANATIYFIVIKKNRFHQCNIISNWQNTEVFMTCRADGIIIKKMHKSFSMNQMLTLPCKEMEHINKT